MSEWGVVTVLIALVGLISTVAVPLSKNTKAMTQLSGQIELLAYRIKEEENNLEAFKEKSADRHEKIFNQLDEQSDRLTDHENRITNLEKTK